MSGAFPWPVRTSSKSHSVSHNPSSQSRSKPLSGKLRTAPPQDPSNLPKLDYGPVDAAATLSRIAHRGKGSEGAPALRFTCLVQPDDERLAIVVKRQLEAIGVVIDLREASFDEILQALRTQTYEA